MHSQNINAFHQCNRIEGGCAIQGGTRFGVKRFPYEGFAGQACQHRSSEHREFLEVVEQCEVLSDRLRETKPRIYDDVFYVQVPQREYLLMEIINDVF